MNNVVGKLLIVMQLVFSILFMCFAGAVYSYSNQWKKKAETAEEQLVVARQQTEDAKEQFAADLMTLTERAKTAEAERDEALARIDNFQTEAANLTAKLAAAELELGKAIADAQVASTEAAARVVESNALNKEVQSLRGRIAELRLELQAMEDNLLDVQGKLAGAREMEEQLLTRVARLNDLLRVNDIDPRVAVLDGDVPEQVEKVDGFVEATRRNQSRTQELLRINIGSDDKIYEDMRLTVYRGDKYICQVRVIEVYADMAVCVVDESTRNGLVQVGDNVTTKL
jgi:chromosome segregation ATPase